MSTPTSQVDPAGRVDGRTARAVRTRLALVDAIIALVEAGDLRPTAPRIAEHAGVSVRSLFQHFDDLETLFGAMGERVVERISQMIEPIDASLPLAERKKQLVDQRCRVNEVLTPINQAASLHAATSATITRQFKQGYGFASHQVAEAFAPELEQAGDGGKALHQALVIAISWATWNLMRTIEGRTVAEATATVTSTVDLILAGSGRKTG